MFSPVRFVFSLLITLYIHTAATSYIIWTIHPNFTSAKSRCWLRCQVPTVHVTNFFFELKIYNIRSTSHVKCELHCNDKHQNEQV